MNPGDELKQRLRECPLVAVLRGVRPDEAAAVGTALVEAGVRIIEIPLNTSRALDCLARLVEAVGGSALVGAGTVLDPAQADDVAAVGGRIAVSPNVDPAVVAATVKAGLVSVPGCLSPSEAFVAIRAGAHGLKFFPAEAATPAVVRALRSVLPSQLPLLVFGGVQPGSMKAWSEAGANGFGIGSGLYRPGQDAGETFARARLYVEALRD